MTAFRDRLQQVCPRCLKTSQRIVAGRLCVSCYNRDREVCRGTNGKGKPPVRIQARLAACRVVVIEGGKVSYLAEERSAGPIELVLRSARQASAGIAFGWAPPATRAA